MQVQNLDLTSLAEFLIKAKVNTYASHNSDSIVPERPGFKELEFREHDWYYRDSYSGFYFAPGQEVVYFRGEPTWTMAYSGGMVKDHRDDFDFAKETFAVLKEALKLVKTNKPFRGPAKLTRGDFEYTSNVEGDITDFSGTEQITFKGKIVFKQNYIGGLVVGK